MQGNQVTSKQSSGEFGSELPQSFEVGRADRQLRIAVVYSRIPFPMTRGDQRTVANLLSFLAARGHRTDFYTLNLHGTLTSDQETFLRRCCRDVKIYSHGLIRKLTGLLMAILKGWPVQVGYFWNGPLAGTLRSHVDKGEYDIIYVYYIRSAPVPGDRFSSRGERRAGGAAFLAMQLSQTLNLERLVKGCASWWKRAFYAWEASRMRKYESTIWQKFNKVLLIGPKDVAALETACRAVGNRVPDNVLFGAHGTDIKAFRPATESEVVRRRVLFSGNMSYRPNVDAIIWFVTHCWQSILSKFPDAQLYIVGWRPTEEVLALGRQPGITVTGEVADLGAYIRSADVCINPVLAAAGMQNKLVEYLASRRPVVCTAVANEGIQAHADCLVIAESAEAFSDGVCQCLADSVMAEQMADRGRAFVEKHWTWESHFLKLERDFLSVLESDTSVAESR